MEEYEAYKNLPRWTLDDRRWVGEDGKRKYTAHWGTYIDGCMRSARDAQSKWKAACKYAVKSVEAISDGSAREFAPEKMLAYQPIDIAYAQINEAVALLGTNPAQGQVVGFQESEAQYIAALNTLLRSEILANNVYDHTLFDVMYEGEFFAQSWLKVGVDYDRWGHYGQNGRIFIERVDCEDMHWDPKAKRPCWEDCDFLIQEHDYDIGDIRQLFPITGFDVPDEAESTYYSSVREQEAGEDAIVSPIAKYAREGGPTYKRQKIKTLECWFKDSRLKFEAKLETQEHTEYDEFGTPIKTYNKDVPKVDEDGYVVGEWRPAYPNGRCIIWTMDVILEDQSNRCPHGKAPFISIPMSPSKRPCVAGDATRILIIATKINDLLGRIHRFYQREIERPMHAEFGTFPNVQYAKRLPDKSDKVLMVNQGKIGTFMRPPAQDVPQFCWNLIEKYLQILDLISGSSGIMRGTVSDGAQLSAEAMASLQQFASSRLAMKAKYLQAAVKELYFHLMWWVRAVYNENISVDVTMPDGTPQKVDWNSDRAIFQTGTEDQRARLVSSQSYIVDIKAGTGTPNAAQARQAMADHLFDRNAIDRIAYLDAYEYPERKAINERKRKEELENIKASAYGRQLGYNIEKIQKNAGKADGPGRREKYD